MDKTGRHSATSNHHVAWHNFWSCLKVIPRKLPPPVREHDQWNAPLVDCLSVCLGVYWDFFVGRRMKMRMWIPWRHTWPMSMKRWGTKHSNTHLRLRKWWCSWIRGSADNLKAFKPFTPKRDQFQISPAASPVTLYHTVWRTWLYIAYSDERWSYYLTYTLLWLGECTVLNWEVKGFIAVTRSSWSCCMALTLSLLRSLSSKTGFNLLSP